MSYSLRSRLPLIGLSASLAWCTHCTPSERAPIEADLQRVMTAQNVGCLLAAHTMLSVHDHALDLIVCSIAPPLEQAALALLQAEDVARVGARDAGTQ